MAEQSHHDENSAPNQHDDKRPKPVAEEEPMQTPVVSMRTPDAQYPTDGQVAQVGHRVKAAAGFHAIWETFRFGYKEAPIKNVYTLAVVNQKGGFDCPSCAWPDPDAKRGVFEYCENGAKAVAWEATSKRVTPEFFAQYSIADLASKTEQWLGDAGRITHPMVLRRGSQNYEPITWPDAFKMIADELNALASPDEAMFYTSGRTSNEAAFVYQLFVRQFGTNNLPDCSNMCHESSGKGLTESIGIGKGTVKLSDFDHADCIFIIGQNPGTCHPRMLTELQKAVKNGCKIISVNPLAETGMIAFKHPQHPIEMMGSGTPIACLFLPVKINGDVAALKGIMKYMLEMDRESGGKIFDHEFIRDKTEGFEAFVKDLDETPWHEIEERSGVSLALLKEAAEIASKSQRMITCWAMGITQHKNGVANVQTIANFNLLRGQIGRQGAGVCPVRGHSNVQGDRTVGIWEQMSDKFMKALGKGIPLHPARQTRLRRSLRPAGYARRKSKSLLRYGRQFPRAMPRHRIRRRSLPPHEIERASLHEVKPQSSHHRRTSAHPPVSRTNRKRRTERRRTVRKLRKLHGSSPGEPGCPRPGQRTSHVRNRNRLSSRRCNAKRKNHGRLDESLRQLRPYPRPHRASRPRLPGLQQTRPRRRRLLSPQPAT